MAGVVISKTKMMIPDHVVEDILTRLPVKSLLRFICVCKTWCSIFSDPHFRTNLHRKRRVVLICENFNKFSTITIESLLSSTPTPFSLSLPWETDSDDVNQVLGSCNGLVCVDLTNSRIPEKSGLILWNPSTRKFTRLARPSCYDVQEEETSRTFTWFGYDESVDDYKIVWLYCSDESYDALRARQLDVFTMSDESYHAFSERQLHVFTMKSNTWRRIPIDDIKLLLGKSFSEAPCMTDSKSVGFLYKGAIHWSVYVYKRWGSWHSAFLAFDLATEKFQLLKFPDAPRRRPSDSWIWVGRIRGCLCISTKLKLDNEEEDGVDLWIMKEYGSWTKFISFPFKLNPNGLPFYKFYPNLFLEDPNLFSKEEANEMLALIDYANAKMITSGTWEGVLRFRIEGGDQNVRFEEVASIPRLQNRVFLHVEEHMEESLVSLDLADLNLL